MSESKKAPVTAIVEAGMDSHHLCDNRVKIKRIR